VLFDYTNPSYYIIITLLLYDSTHNPETDGGTYIRNVGKQ